MICTNWPTDHTGHSGIKVLESPLFIFLTSLDQVLQRPSYTHKGCKESSTREFDGSLLIPTCPRPITSKNVETGALLLDSVACKNNFRDWRSSLIGRYFSRAKVAKRFQHVVWRGISQRVKNEVRKHALVHAESAQLLGDEAPRSVAHN